MSKNVERVLIYIESMNTNEEGGSRTRLTLVNYISSISCIFYLLLSFSTRCILPTSILHAGRKSLLVKNLFTCVYFFYHR